MRYLAIILALAVAACSSPTAPTRVIQPRAVFDVGGSTSPADKGSCNPNGDTNAGNLKHCSPGHAPGGSNSPGSS